MKHLKIGMSGLFLAVFFLGSSSGLAETFRAGAAAVDISPQKLPVIVSGSFLERKSGRVSDPLFARAIALDDGKTRCVICIVDTLFVPGDLMDAVKREAAEATGIPADKMMIAATHTHSAPSIAGALGTGVDENYRKFLPPKIVEVIQKAVSRLAPAKAGWTMVDAPAHTHCRRWILRSDRIRTDVFGGRTVRANMHPGYQHPDFVGPAGPADRKLSLLSLQSADGKPLAVLANYSMHYFGAGDVSADYFGRFVVHFSSMIGEAGKDSGFVAAMSQGTSGDLHWYDYSKPRKSVTMESYAKSLAEIAAKAYKKIHHKDWLPLTFLERNLSLSRRVPDKKRLDWARKIAVSVKGRAPRSRPEVYALEQIHVHNDPVREVKLQVLGVGDLGITAIPCEVYGITGMKIKLQSPMAGTFNLELANGCEGYIPPPEQHVLGGYTTWTARSAGLEVNAEPKIVDAILSMLEEASGRKRRAHPAGQSDYERTVLSSRPTAYWPMNELAGGRAHDVSGNKHDAAYEDGVALYLRGPDRPDMNASHDVSRSVHFAGGRMKARLPEMGDRFSVSMWIWNGFPPDAREVAGYFLSLGAGDDKKTRAVNIGIGGIRQNAQNKGKLILTVDGAADVLSGKTELGFRQWHHIVLARKGKRLAVFLDGIRTPEIEADVPAGFPLQVDRLAVGGSWDGMHNFEGKAAHVAVYSKVAKNVEDDDYISWVDPRIESARGRWFFSTPAARPFGMVKLTPHTVNRGQGGGGYNASVNTALGFCHLHGWMTTGLEVMPTTSGDFSVDKGEPGWQSEFDPETEVVKPGYHKLFLEKYAMWVELTTTKRVGFHRYTYTQDGRADIIVNLGGQAGPMKMKNGRITKVSDTQLEGYYDRTNGTWGGPAAVRIFFVMQFQEPFVKFTTYNDPAHNSTSAFVTFDNISAGDKLQMKAALSFTSIANARKNLSAELAHWDFDAVRDDSFKIWNRWLSRIDVEGGTKAERTKFYTDLWHVLLGRHVLNDVNGAYPDYTNGKGGNGPLKVRQLPLDSGGKPRFNMYNSDAYWLTQWNINLVWGLAWPRMLDEFCNASLQMARDGAKLPRGPCGGGYTHIMTACPATMMIVGAYMKGCYTFDPEEAFAIIKDNHSVGGANMLGASDFYVERGWRPGSAGWTVEMCFQDWCAAQLAKKLGKIDDYKEFMRRSTGWKHLFHGPTGLLMPRNADGRFSHANPLSGRGWVEANAWQGSWFTSHDVQGLANLMGGLDEYCRKLNFAFEQEVDHDFVHGYGSGHVSYANQPGCQNAHLFNFAGKPWLTQYWVRRVNAQAYGGTTIHLGYGGHDEDQGQMGGVSALMSMGLFSVRGTCAADPIYEITSPVFDKITIALDDKFYSGKEFIITAANNSADNVYIQSAKLDGKPLNNVWFYHRDFADGGTLELVLGPKPNRNWGVAELPPSESPPALPVKIEPAEQNLQMPTNSVQLRGWVKDKQENWIQPDHAFQWKLLEGPGQAEFSHPDKPETWACFDRPGTYTIGMEASMDGRAGTGRTVVKVLCPAWGRGAAQDGWTIGGEDVPAGKRDPEARRIKFLLSSKYPAGTSYVIQYRKPSGKGAWRMLPGLVFIRRESTDTVRLEAKLPDWIKESVGLEFRLRVTQQPVNYAAGARVSVSSAYNRDYAGKMAVDGIKGIHMASEWSSKAEAKPWIQLDWEKPVTIRRIHLYDRANLDDHTQAGVLTFSDGSRIPVSGMANNGAVKAVTFEAKKVQWIRFQVTGGQGANRGLSEMEALSGAEVTVYSKPF